MVLGFFALIGVATVLLLASYGLVSMFEAINQYEIARVRRSIR